MSTLGDKLFEAFCSRSGVGCRRIPETAARRPDYELYLGPHHLFAEVKTLDPNSAEGEVNARRYRGEIVAGGGVPGERLRREIRSANKQFKALVAGRSIPTLLVVFNNYGCGIHTDPYSVMTAMQGLDTIEVRVPSDPGSAPSFGPTRSGPERAMRFDANTSTSALALLHGNDSQDIRLAVYHNRHAAVPLDPSVLRMAMVIQFRLPDDAVNSVETAWLEV